MTHVDDLYEPGDDREPAEPEQEPPLDLNAVEESIRIYYGGSDDDSGKAAEDLVTVTSRLVAELGEARRRIAEFEALPVRERWAVTTGPDDRPGPFAYWYGSAADAEAALLYQDNGGQLWRERTSVHPWEPFSTDAPF